MINCLPCLRPLLLAFLLSGSRLCLAQVVSDSALSYKYYHGLMGDSYTLTDTAGGTIHTNYFFLSTPYQRIQKIIHISKLRDKAICGTWLADTTLPSWAMHKMRFEKDHTWYRYDSVGTENDRSGKKTFSERIVKGNWELRHDTLFTSITACVTCNETSWRIDVGGASGFVRVKRLLYLVGNDEQFIYSTRRYRKVKNK